MLDDSGIIQQSYDK